MPQIRIEEHIAALAPDAWNALLEQSPQPTPFMRHEYLSALIDSGSATADTGWAPLVLAVEGDEGELLAACIAWIKSHSYGEYGVLSQIVRPTYCLSMRGRARGRRGARAYAGARERAKAAHGTDEWPETHSQ